MNRVGKGIVMADIKDVATSIKQVLGGWDDRDLEFLARLFDDNSISDTGTGNELANRLTTILAASADAKNNGVTHFSGIYAGCKDLGFRTEFKDLLWPVQSGNQVGHFTTAVDMGFRPLQTFALVPWWAAALLRTANPAPGVAAEYVCERLIIGHEQVADNDPNANDKAAKTADDSEIALFEKALSTVTPDLKQNPQTSLSILKGIRVGSGQGNSIQDLHLSLFGFKFGQMIRAGTINTRSFAAKWIRSNIGGVDREGVIDDGVQPAPGTAAV
jgi:hypothetical protein